MGFAGFMVFQSNLHLAKDSVSLNFFVRLCLDAEEVFEDGVCLHIGFRIYIFKKMDKICLSNPIALCAFVVG